MTTIKLNHEGVDVVEVKASATGTNEIHFTTKSPIFNADLGYVFCVTDLNVDTSSLPIFPPDTASTLFKIKKRHLTAANDGTLIDVELPAGTPQQLQLLPDGRKYFDTGSFLADVSGTANTFSSLQDAAGVIAADHGIPGGAANLDIPPGHYNQLDDYYLKIGFDAGGRVLITGVSAFWNHFVIEFSDLAVKLFQLEDVVGVDFGRNVLSLTRPPGATVAQTKALYTNPALLQVGDILTTHTVVGRSSVLKFCDHRLFVTVETHLPTERNLRVHNGSEQTDASIIRSAFLNMAESTVYSKGKIIVDDVTLTTKSYVGRTNFVKKTEPIMKWNTLTSSYEQRIFRFFVYCVYNIFAAGVYTQTKIAVPFSDLGEWDLTLRFVSKI